jgi:hypothetical protein
VDSNKDDNHGMGRHDRVLDSDDDKKEDEQKEENDINEDSTVMAALAKQRACVMAEGGGDRA